jgi:hypothetical protein
MYTESDLETNRRLLADAREHLKGRSDRETHVTSTIEVFKRQVIREMEEGRWDSAQATLLQAKSLDGERGQAKADKEHAEGRVKNLENAVKDTETALDALKRPRPKTPSKPKPEAKKAKATS